MLWCAAAFTALLSGEDYGTWPLGDTYLLKQLAASMNNRRQKHDGVVLLLQVCPVNAGCMHWQPAVQCKLHGRCSIQLVNAST